METYSSLKKLAKQAKTTIKRIHGTDNVLIGGTDYKQIGGNVGISATEMLKARKRLNRR